MAKILNDSFGAAFPHFCTDKREIWNEGAPRAKFHIYRGNVSPLWGENPFFETKTSILQWAVSWSPRRYLLYVLCQKNRQKFENLMPRGSKTIHRTKQVHQQDKVAILGVHYPRRGATPPLWLTFLESCRRSDVKIDMQRCDLPLSRYSVFTGQNFGFWGSPAGGIAPNGENSLPIRPVPICTIMQNHFTPIGATIAEISSQKTGHRIGDSPGEGATVPCYTFLESRHWVELMLSSNWHGTLRLTVF